MIFGFPDLEDLRRNPGTHHDGLLRLQNPSCRLARLYRHVDGNPHVRKPPLDVGDHALDGNQLLDVEHRARMMADGTAVVTANRRNTVSMRLAPADHDDILPMSCPALFRCRDLFAWTSQVKEMAVGTGVLHQQAQLPSVWTLSFAGLRSDGHDLARRGVVRECLPADAGGAKVIGRRPFNRPRDDLAAAVLDVEADVDVG